MCISVHAQTRTNVHLCIRVCMCVFHGINAHACIHRSIQAYSLHGQVCNDDFNLQHNSDTILVGLGHEKDNRTRRTSSHTHAHTPECMHATWIRSRLVAAKRVVKPRRSLYTHTQRGYVCVCIYIYTRNK